MLKQLMIKSYYDQFPGNISYIRVIRASIIIIFGVLEYMS